MKEGIESQDFYELMQAYRMADTTDQLKVVERFNAVKDYIKQDNADLLDVLKHMLSGTKIISRMMPKHKGLKIDIKIAEEAIKKAEGK